MDVAMKGVAVGGCVVHLVSYKKILNSLWLAEKCNQVLIQLFRLHLCG